MKWGLICSVNDSNYLECLNFSAKWLINQLENHSNQFNLNHSFKPEASFCFHCEPGNRKAIYKIYETIFKDHSDVIYVIHILPEENSLEFKMLKSLTINYALIGQGILFDKALSRFSDCNLNAVLQNLNQYISRRISQIICYRRKENSYRLLIGGTKPLSNQQQYNFEFEDAISKCAEMVLHSNYENLSNHVTEDCVSSNSAALIEDETVRYSPFTLIVNGFPEYFNKFQIASLFSTPPFFPIYVFISPSGKAFVDFPNKFQAAHAYILYKTNQKLIDEHANAGIFLTLNLADNLAQKSADRILSTNV